MSRQASRLLVAVPLVLAMALPAPAAPADDSGAVLERGEKLRLTSLDRSRVEGYLLSADPERITLRRLDGTERTLPRTEITRIEVARRNRARAAAGGGLVAGVVFGFAGLMAFGIDRMTPRSADGRTCRGTDLFGGGYEYRCTTAGDLAGYVGAGVVLGAVIGGSMNPERYVKVPSGRVAVRVVPAPKGVAVQASVGF